MLLLGFAPISEQATRQAPHPVHLSHPLPGQPDSILTGELEPGTPPQTDTSIVPEPAPHRHEMRRLTLTASYDRVRRQPLVEIPYSTTRHPTLTQQAAAAKFRAETRPVTEAFLQIVCNQCEAPVSHHVTGRARSGTPDPQVRIKQIGEELTEQYIRWSQWRCKRLRWRQRHT